jgi:hypothetical protein
MAIIAQLLNFLWMEVVNINVTYLTNHNPLNSNGRFIPKVYMRVNQHSWGS